MMNVKNENCISMMSQVPLDEFLDYNRVRICFREIFRDAPDLVHVLTLSKLKKQVKILAENAVIGK